MHDRRRHRRSRRHRTGAVFCIAMLFGATTGFAVLHLALKRSEPIADSRIEVPPMRISLWFTAKPQVEMSRIALTGPAGQIALDEPMADTGFSVHATVRQSLRPGAYRVAWQTASADGHPIRGEFAFTVMGGGTGAGASIATTDTSAVRPSAAAGHGAEMVYRDESGSRTARWMEFAALLAVLGALGFRHGVLPPLAVRGVPTADASDRARRLGQSILALYGIAAIVRLYMQSAAIYGRDAALDTAELWALVSRTTWGVGWSLGVVGAAILLIGWRISKRSVTIGTPLALTGALGMVLSPALSGHAAASRHFIWSVTLDTLHVAAAGVWIGGLLMVLFAGIPAMLRLPDGNKHAAVSALVNSFHPIALFCAPLAVVAGAGMSWIRLGSASALWTTLYGKTLLIKIALVLAVAAVGAYNSLRARRRLGSADGLGTVQFRMTGGIELLVGAIVVVITTFLVVTPVPSEMAP